MNGIITLPLVPLRESQNDHSEMITQLLFGERIEIIEMHEKCLYVKNLTDNTKGWLDRKMIQLLTDEEDLQLSNVLSYCVSIPALYCDKLYSKEKILQ